MSLPAIQTIEIVGGTHGNELTGIYLVQKWQKFPESLKREGLEILTLLSNPKAIALNRRYVDRDLNRCFTDADLSNLTLSSYEDQRAKVIAAQLGPRCQPAVDVILDLHSTTANMGVTILPSSRHPVNLAFAAYLTTIDPEVRVCFAGHYGQDTAMLRSLTSFGGTIEVGPVPQGILHAERIQKTEKLVQAALDFWAAIASQQPLNIPSELVIYQGIGTIDYPRDSQGQTVALVHPDRQFQDYQPMQSGDPLFLSQMNETIPYEGETVFPVFINEAAYYEKSIAMVMTKPQNLLIESIK